MAQKSSAKKTTRRRQQAKPKSHQLLMSLLQTKDRRENNAEAVRVSFTIPALAPEGALLAEQVITEMFPKAKMAMQVEHGFFGPYLAPPQRRSVALSDTESVEVGWGSFEVPELDATINMQARDLTFALTSSVTMKTQDAWKAFETEVTKRALAGQLLFKGRALKLNFGDDAAGLAATPTPVKMTGIDPSMLVLNTDVEEAINASVFSVLKHADSLKVLGIPRKRGVLLEGNYGVGKTLIAGITAKMAVENGFTFFLVNTAAALSQAFELAKRYGRTVVFVEDLDQVAHNDRDSLNSILNTIDGLDAKGEEIMVVATTNFVDRIDPAFLRPGRIDDVIHVAVPDTETRDRMIRHFAGDLLGTLEPLGSVISVLEGATPAMVREAVERAKLRMLSAGAMHLTSEMLLKSANSLERQRALAAPKFIEQTPMQQFGNAVGKEINSGIDTAIGKRFGY